MQARSGGAALENAEKIDQFDRKRPRCNVDFERNPTCPAAVHAYDCQSQIELPTRVFIHTWHPKETPTSVEE